MKYPRITLRKYPIVPAILFYALISLFAKAGTVTMTTSTNSSATRSSDGLSIIAQDIETVLLEATCTNGTVSVTYTPSSQLSQQSDTGSGTTDEKTVFSISTPGALDLNNTISANVTHNATNNGNPCLPGGKAITFNIFVPQLTFDTSSYTTGSTGDTSIAAFGSAVFYTSSPPIGLTSGKPQFASGGPTSPGEGIPYEYQVRVAPNVSVYTGFSNSAMGIQETATLSEYVNGTLVSGPTTRPAVNYNSGAYYYNVGGTSSNPIAYAIDFPSAPSTQWTAYYGPTVTSVMMKWSLQSTPTYNGKLVGKTVTHIFTITANVTPSSGYTQWAGTD
jgi:hypothetical protein